jgi:hypothetical protein
MGYAYAGPALVSSASGIPTLQCQNLSIFWAEKRYMYLDTPPPPPGTEDLAEGLPELVSKEA